MSTPPTATDVDVVYTSIDLCAKYLPPFAIAPVEQTIRDTGYVLQSDFDELARSHSRKLDARLSAIGFQTPFPDITENNPRPPDDVVDIVTYNVVAEISSILKFGNRRAPKVSFYREEADTILANVVATPKILGLGRVRTPENIQTQAGSGTAPNYKEAGIMTGPWYRLKNRNIVPKSIRFCRADGSEAFRTDGLPFIHGLDWAIMSLAEGTIAVYNTGMMFTQMAALGGTGGVLYDFSWRRYDYGQALPNEPMGVGR